MKQSEDSVRELTEEKELLQRQYRQTQNELEESRDLFSRTDTLE